MATRTPGSTISTLLLLAAVTLLVCTPALAGKRTIERGEYLTAILGCGGCHTEGALEGRPYGNYLTGSPIGIAYTDYRPDEAPGIVFPGNLTPDPQTGLGTWKEADIVRFLQTGKDHTGGQATSVMPWFNYATVKPRDLKAIAAYLLSLEPVVNPIPARVSKGQESPQAYLRFGVFLVDPSITDTPIEVQP